MSTNVSPVSANTFSQISSKGRILTHDGTSAVSLAPGSDGQVISSVSSAASGLGYVALSTTLPTSYHNAIVSSTLTTTASSILFTGLTAYGDYKYLKVVGVTKHNSGTSTEISININSVTTDASTQTYRFSTQRSKNYWTATGQDLQASGSSSQNIFGIQGTARPDNSDSEDWGFVEILAAGSEVGNSSLTWRAFSFDTSASKSDVLYQRGYTSGFSFSGGMNSIKISPPAGSFIVGTSFVLYVYK
jgi:hypothetical protein